jgi:hypothetical protein
MEALREIAVCSPDRLEDVLWFHDADFDVDDISLDEEKETRTIVFDQAVDQLPDDLELPRPDVEKRGRFAIASECRSWSASWSFEKPRDSI